MTDWTVPPATDEQFRAAGYTARARQFPLTERGARWVATFNGIGFENIPAAWCYAPNQVMADYVEGQAGIDGEG